MIRRLSVAVVILSSMIAALRCWAGSGDVAIKTQPVPGNACLAVPQPGTLIADRTWGLALRGKDEAAASHDYGVIWPYGYRAELKQGKLELIDESGSVVAREGDQVELDAATSDPLTPCADIKVV